MNNAIVTGGTGFIGSRLIQELLDNNIKVLAIVRNKYKLNPTIVSDKGLSVIEAPLFELHPNDIPEKYHNCDCFFHLAWDGVSPEYKNEVEIQLSNIRLAMHAIRLCSDIHCKKMIAAGTVAEYVFGNDAMNVDARQSPNDMYGAAKVSTHYFLDVLSRQLDQPFNWVVLPSTYGEGRTDNNIITYTIRMLLRGERPVYGNLEQMWDFLYVSEVARALRLIGYMGVTYRVL